MKKNLFIAFEGIDGSGKSTQAKMLAKRLTDEGHKVHLTFEPTDGTIGTLLRNILKGAVKADERTIAGLFLADRLDHLLNEHNGLVKMLAEGYTVITDRYYFSSYAYHGVHMDLNWVIAANEMCATILRPHINLFIDVPTSVCMERIMSNRASTERYENLENLNNVKAKYNEAFVLKAHEENITHINGNRSEHEVADDIYNMVCKLMLMP